MIQYRPYGGACNCYELWKYSSTTPSDALCISWPLDVAEKAIQK